MSPLVAFAADCLVSCLLVVAIATSLRLSRRIAAMKADEAAMRATITELLVATEKADAAIAALRVTVVESERSLSDRLGAAARHADRLAQEVAAGEAVVDRVSRIAAISRRLSSEEAAARPVPIPPAPAAPAAEDGLRTAIRLARDAVERSARRSHELAA